MNWGMTHHLKVSSFARECRSPPIVSPFSPHADSGSESLNLTEQTENEPLEREREMEQIMKVMVYVSLSAE